MDCSGLLVAGGVRWAELALAPRHASPRQQVAQDSVLRPSQLEDTIPLEFCGEIRLFACDVKVGLSIYIINLQLQALHLVFGVNKLKQNLWLVANSSRTHI